MIRLNLMVLSGLLSFIMPVMFAVDPNCNYYQNMVIGESYYIYNKEYPGYYNSLTKECLWRAVAPSGNQIQINCTLDLPQSPSCNLDRVLISLTGSPNLENSHTYCGSGSTDLMITEGNSISLGLHVDQYTTGGRFLCVMKVKENSPPPECDCGQKNTRRIVGGIETKVNEYPMMAALIDSVFKELFCGATIISHSYSITAAHCIDNKDPNIVGLLVGEHDITSGTETNATRLLRVSHFVIHPSFIPGNQRGENDIAIVKTTTPLQFNMAVSPACLPFTNQQDSFAYQNVEVLGWGTTEFTGPKSPVLLKTDLDVLNYDQCYATVGGTIDQMCTFRQGHDSCQSDSGGPVLWFDQYSYRIKLVGVISSGIGCGTTNPGVNTRVTSYLLWIMAHTQDASFCVK